MSTERGPAISEHAVADLEGGDAAADRLDFSRKLFPRTVTRGLRSPVKNRTKKGLAARKPQSVRFTVVA
jgi:hypothetical protein